MNYSSVFLRPFLVIVSFAVSLTAFSQNQKLKPAPKVGPIIEFDKTHHNYGVLYEDMKFASYKFEFTNVGDQPVRIIKVESSCGCTTPYWSQDSIPSGQRGFVETKYETVNHIGEFKKNVTVYTNSPTNPMILLTIEGNVIRPKVQNTVQTPSLGDLVFNKPAVVFEPLYDDRLDSQIIKLTNNTPYTTHFEPLSPVDIPSFCNIKNFPSALEPGEFANVKIVIDARKMMGYGFNAFVIPILSDNVVRREMGMSITYRRRQYFPKFSAKELAKQPHLEIPSPTYDFGNQLSGDFLKGNFVLKNTGKSDLIFKQITPDCPCIKVTYPKTKLAPGESMVLDFIYDTVTKNGAKAVGIQIVNNDPTQPERYILVKAQFQEKFKYSCPTCN